MLFAVGRNSLAGDETGIVDCLREGQHFEIALGKVAQRVEIEHLTAVIKKRVLGVIAHGRTADDHSGVVRAAAGVTAGVTHVATECSQIGHTEIEVRVCAR